jgi:hypothetical protein
LASPSNQRLCRRGDIGHQIRRRLKIPVGVLDIGMPEICRQGDEVPGDRTALGTALFQNPCCEGMAKVVNAR